MKSSGYSRVRNLASNLASMTRSHFFCVIFCTIFAGVGLAGCKTAPIVKDVSPVEPVRAKPSAEAMVECQRASGLEDDSFGAVVRKLSEVLGLLDECASKHGELRDYIKRD